MGYICSYII